MTSETISIENSIDPITFQNVALSLILSFVAQKLQWFPPSFIDDGWYARFTAISEEKSHFVSVKMIDMKFWKEFDW